MYTPRPIHPSMNCVTKIRKLVRLHRKGCRDSVSGQSSSSLRTCGQLTLAMMVIVSDYGSNRIVANTITHT